TLSATNYDFPVANFVAGTLTVNRSEERRVGKKQSKTYGADNPTLTDTITGFVGTDTVAVVSGAASCSTTAITSTGVGTYPITCTQGTLSATNYDFPVANFVAGTLTINKATPLVCVLPSSTQYS